MPGRTTDSMTASWLALETVTTEAGPLIYYPGSHRIPLFKFSNSAPHMVVAEMPDYEAHMSSWVAALGLRPQAFLPNKGDLLIWHERLFHGGTTIEDMALTRKSMVVHYWRREHVESVKPAHGGFTLDRPPM
jgi:ectoine hydroxylase-related dioxygenase (phytanoyl-CoA dioxygenase family)